MNVLIIANSFGVDANRYLHRISREGGAELQTIVASIGGCPLERHYRNMLSDRPDYSIHCNGWRTEIFVPLETVLLSREWDVITIQQASPNSPDADSYEPYDRELAEYIRICQPKAKLLIHQTWAYQEGPKLASTGFETPKAMLSAIQSAYAASADRCQVDGIIPSGEVLMRLLDAGVETVHRDGKHASYGLGRYAIALLWFRMLTGKTVTGNTFRDFDEEIYEENIALAQKIVDSCQPLYCSV